MKEHAAAAEQAAPANDDLVGMVGIPLVADVIEPADMCTVARHDSVALGGRKQATELRLPSQPRLGALIAAAMPHGKKRNPAHAQPETARRERSGSLGTRSGVERFHGACGGPPLTARAPPPAGAVGARA
jgi:hypothetical protein